MTTILFDAVGTLIVPSPSVAEVYTRFGKENGSRRTLAEVQDRFPRVFRDTFRPLSGATDEPTERLFWKRVVAAVLDDLPGSARETCFEQLFDHFGRAEAWQVVPHAEPVLQELSRRGYRLAIASNFDSRLRAVVAGHPALTAIQRVFVSSEIGWRKPDPRFLRAICAKWQLTPRETLLVGDDPACDQPLPDMWAVWIDPRMNMSPRRRTGELSIFGEPPGGTVRIRDLAELPGYLIPAKGAVPT